MFLKSVEAIEARDTVAGDFVCIPLQRSLIYGYVGSGPFLNQQNIRALVFLHTEGAAVLSTEPFVYVHVVQTMPMIRIGHCRFVPETSSASLFPAQPSIVKIKSQGADQYLSFTSNMVPFDFNLATGADDGQPKNNLLIFSRWKVQTLDSVDEPITLCSNFQ